MQLKEIVDLIRYKQLIAILSYVLCVFVLALANNALDARRALLVLVGTVALFGASYGYNYITDVKEDQIAGKNNPALNFKTTKIGLVLIVFTLVAVAVGIILGTLSLSLALCILLLGFIYSHKSVRLKAKGWLKTVSVAFSWFLTYLFMLSVFPEISPLIGIFVGIFLVLISIKGTILRDVLDMGGDERMKVQTVPIMLGKPKTTAFVMGVTVLQNLLLLGVVLALVLPIKFLLLLFVLPVRAAVIYGMQNEKYGIASKCSLLSYPLVAVVLYAVEVML
ncbi:MAG: UbiA family prenyltransferase [Candidatus Micrarchaeota archaeon]